ncbi:TetR/AcrR family transcriptional regulator [Rathayibacter sp. VKM Ac-2754]|uniref:TetR/AcrR family transcriptional regulator n=1 Tax=Rathayibacter sp. VKM Ac-2754 TaxID=2609251 RepID=UPI0013571021|nr:TetR family transcriptional regulator C-terminal domain-containing protein [Rathayibacter sp. VKM Ac-2754]MWV57802.1 TetR family transcriptional regulator [Rathayibacter sp. VKM Ac-2754]
MARARDETAIQEKLSEAVFATLAERGAVGLTLRAVAERADCTTGLVLHTFRDKRALLLHARDVLHERTRLRFDALTTDDLDPEAALRAVASAALPTDPAGLAEARAWIGFLSAALSDPILAERHAVHNRAFVERLEGLLEAIDGPRPDAPDRAAALASAVEGISTLAAGDADSWTPDRQRRALDVVLAAVLGAR